MKSKEMKNPVLAFIIYSVFFLCTAYGIAYTIKSYLAGNEVLLLNWIALPFQIFSVFYSGFKILKIADEKTP